MGAIGVLGPLTVDGDAGTLPPRERAVLAALAMRRGEVVSAETMADAWWGDRLPATWNKAIQGCMVQLRKTLGAGAIETSRQGYCLVVPADEIDAYRFERLIARGQELMTLGEVDRAAYVLDEALSLWRGTRALVELEGWEPGRNEATRLEELRRDAEELRLDAVLRAGRYREVLAEAQARVAEAPLREYRWALLALAQYQAGRQDDSLRTLRQARMTLVRELGLDPGPDIVALEEAILRQDPSLVAAQLPEPSAVCPYQGLVPYDVADSDAFFGRDTEVSECLRRLAEAGMLAVVGPSGSGKSSMVRAGVAAAVERDGRRVVIITPGIHPMDALSVLPTSGLLPVLVVDQCEEAVTLCRDAGERARFFVALAKHAEDAPLVVALRGDRFGELSAHPEFARLVERGLYLLKSMGDADLRAAIEGPARQAGLLLEPGLVDLLVRDVEGEPGALPLLSHALRQTWQRREGRTLTVAGYQASGGIRGAVAQSAEAVYEQAPLEQRPILRDLLLRLVAPSPEGEPVRARVPRRAVAADAEHEQVIEQLVRARLVTSDEHVVELAHEALARAWPRLRGWLDDDVEGQRIWRHLAAAADAWEAMGRPDSELYRGVRLARAVEWRDRTAPDLNPTEQVYLDTSQRHADAERRSVRRRRRALVTGLAAGLAVTTALAAVAFVNQRRATEAAEVARSHELAASAISVLADDPALAKLLAVASATMAEPNLESLSALHRVWAADRVVSRNGSTFEPHLIWADLDPSGQRAVVAGTFPVEGTGQAVEVIDLAADERVWSLSYERDNTSVFLAAPFYSADGEQVVVGSVWDPDSIHRFNEETEEPRSDVLGAVVFDAESGELIDRYDLGRCGGWVAGAAETHLLARTLHGTPDVVGGCRWVDGTWAVELVDRRSGERTVLSTDLRDWWGAAMSGDGRYVAYDDEAANTVAVAEVATGDHVLSFDGGGVRDLNRDGSLLLYGDDPIEVRDVATGEVAATFDDHVGGTLFARFDPSGQTVFSTGRDGVLREWDARTGAELFTHPGLGNGRPSYSDDGLVLVAQPDLDVLALLDTRVRGELGAVETCAGFVWADGLTVANGVATFHTECDGDDHATSYVVDVGSRDVIYTLPEPGARGLAVSPDGSRFVRQESEGHGPLAVHDLRSGEEIIELDSSELSGIWAHRLRWSPDGTMIAAGFDTQVAAWDAETGAILYHQPADPDRLFTVDLLFSPDSTRLVTSSANWVVRAISTESWEPLVERDLIMVDGGYALGWVGQTSDGSLLAAGAFLGNTAGALHWFDPETLDVTRRHPNAHDGSIKAMALHEDGSYAATGSSDGFVRVWDTATGSLVHEIPFGDTQVQGVAFVDDQRLAVTLEEGNLLIVTTDVDELLDLVRSTLTRGFTATECAKFGFDDNCPTLVDLRGPLPDTDDPSVLNGRFRVEWTEDELTAEWMAVGDAEEFAREAAAFDAGLIEVTFADGRFDVVKTQEGPTRLCTGSYSVRGDRAWLIAEHDGICDGRVKMFDATFTLADDALHFHDLRGQLSEQIIFASRPLHKIE
jgi:DNA-binding SARP family transcriptional activator/WD40 repeat protein